MHGCRYTSIVFSNEHVMCKRLGDDLADLTIKLLVRLECQNTSASGIIRDNITGEVVHRCRKSATE
jgi:hypothetical protein